MGLTGGPSLLLKGKHVHICGSNYINKQSLSIYAQINNITLLMYHSEIKDSWWVRGLIISNVNLYFVFQWYIHMVFNGHIKAFLIHMNMYITFSQW